MKIGIELALLHSRNVFPQRLGDVIVVHVNLLTIVMANVAADFFSTRDLS